MKQKWHKKWLKELDTHVPELSEDVLNAPIHTKAALREMKHAEQQEIVPVQKKQTFTQRAKRYLHSLRMRTRAYLCVQRRFVRVTATAAALLLLLMAASAIVVPVNVVSEELGAFALEINPRAVFAVDKEGLVTSVVAGNADADVILASDKRKNEMKGKPISDALEIFVDYAAKLGFLDMETGDIIRVSMCMRSGDVEEICTTLVDYFCEKGIYVAVMAEQVSVATFCDRIGTLSYATLQELVGAYNSTPVLYSEQEATNKTIVELQTNYTQNVAPEEVKSSVENLLKGALVFIAEREASLLEISDLNNKIKGHADNPKVILKDYWNVKKLKDQEFSLEFALLMQSMDVLVEEYEKKYDATIDSELNLKTLQLVVSSELLQEIAKLLADLSMEVFHGNTKVLSEALSWIGVEVDVLDLCETPESKEEYLSKMKSYNEMRYRSLQSEYISVYKMEREAISAQDYQAYLQAIYQEYGTLQNYWNAVNA